MRPYDRENLPQVAQYVAERVKRAVLIDKLTDHLCAELRRRYGRLFSEKQRTQTCNNKLLDELISIVGTNAQARDGNEPHMVLANLSLPIYITAVFNNLLAHALSAKGKNPEVEICHWRSAIGYETIFDREPGYEPDVNRPLVYHLFGRIDQRETLVLTEDDYFDYLIAVSKDVKRIPEEVRTSLTNKSLLFVGFGISDWDFRILFRLILNQQGSKQLENYPHVAVQVTPSDTEFTDPDGVCSYLEHLIGHAPLSGIHLYWGSTKDFVMELQRRLSSPKRAGLGNDNFGTDSMAGPIQAVELFYSYAHEDEKLRIELEKHLSILRDNGIIKDWHDRKIGAGSEWNSQIDQYLNRAQIVLLLVSPDFVFSGYIKNFELNRAMERHDAGEARVIPVILRPVDWEGASFGKLKALPQDARPVTSWSNQDEAFQDIARGIRQVVEELTAKGDDHRSDPSNKLPYPMSESRTRDRQHLGREIGHLQHQWDLLSEKLTALDKQHILETRAEERFRLKHLIEETRTERERIDQQLKALQEQVAKTNGTVTEDGGRNDGQSPAKGG
jgi:hypothetical protein